MKLKPQNSMIKMAEVVACVEWKPYFIKLCKYFPDSALAISLRMYMWSKIVNET